METNNFSEENIYSFLKDLINEFDIVLIKKYI